MQGTLTQTCLPELLRTIYTERRSGELILTQGTVKKQIYFELGQIVFAASNRKEDRLGEALVRHNKLNREQLDQLLASLEQGSHLGKALVEKEVLTDRELITYVTFQLIDIIYSLFTWTLGNYQFAETDENRAPEELKLKFSTATIILEGVRRIEEFDIIRRGLSDLNRLISPTASPLLRLQSLTIKPLERQLLDLVTQPMDLLKILISINEPARNVLQSLYGLLSVGLLQQGEAAELSATTGKFVVPETVRQQAETAPPPEYSARNTASLRAIDVNLLTDLATMKERIATQDPRTILGIAPQSNGADIRDAYYRLATKFHPDKFIQLPRQVREDADLVFNKITDSYNRLRNSITAANIRPAIPGTGNLPPLTQTGSFPAAVPNIVVPPSSYSNPSGVPGGTGPLTAPKTTGRFAVSPSAGRGITRAVSDELGNPSSYQMNKLPQRGAATGKVNVEEALNDLLDYLDDRKAPLFVADSLSLLLRTSPPKHVEQSRVIETIVTWSRQKASIMGRPIHEIFVTALSSIKHAEQARVLADFEPAAFYGEFINELAGYCPANERQEFLNKAGMV